MVVQSLLSLGFKESNDWPSHMWVSLLSFGLCQTKTAVMTLFWSKILYKCAVMTLFRHNTQPKCATITLFPHMPLFRHQRVGANSRRQIKQCQNFRHQISAWKILAWNFGKKNVPQLLAGSFSLKCYFGRDVRIMNMFSFQFYLDKRCCPRSSCLNKTVWGLQKCCYQKTFLTCWTES